METKLVSVPGAQLQVSVWGSGEPVVLIQTALIADELQPLASDQALGDYAKVLYHRRGYEGSSPTKEPGSIARDASDCQALLSELHIDKTHIVGLSYSAAVALQLSVDAPDVPHTLTLIEPPPVHTKSEWEFRDANDRLINTRRQRGASSALDEFLSLVIARDWHEVAERQLPSSSAQMKRDAATFFDADLPTLLSWDFDREDSSRITCPVLYIGGSDSGPWFAEACELMLTWFPWAENVTIHGADHSLALSHAPDIARALLAFLRSHPIGR